MKPSSGATPLVLREHNGVLVRQALKAARYATRQQLAVATGLSTVTVGTILESLLAAGMALEGALVPSNGGRPSRIYRFHPGHNHAAVVFTREVEGRDTVCYRVADLYGQVIDTEDHPLGGAPLREFEAALDGLLTRHPSIRALGFGLPGIEYGGTIVALDYRPLVGAPLIGHFQDRYGLPVVFENDVNAAVLGRGRREGAAESEAYLYFPRKYTPGAGLRVDGRLIKGRHHFAGEVGHLPLGIPWGTPALTDSLEAASEAVARVVVSVTAVFDPQSVVLHSEFLTPDHLTAVRHRCEALLPPGAVPDLTLTTEFTRDFEEGLVGLTLDLVAP